jgi:hypothetical protein
MGQLVPPCNSILAVLLVAIGCGGSVATEVGAGGAPGAGGHTAVGGAAGAPGVGGAAGAPGVGGAAGAPGVGGWTPDAGCVAPMVECVDGYYYTGRVGACREPKSPQGCVAAPGTCPPRSIPASDCVYVWCDGPRPSGACDAGDAYNCYGGMYGYLVGCTCPAGTWTCEL